MIGKLRTPAWGAVLVVSCLAAAPAWAGAFQDELGADVGDKVKLSLANGDQDGNESGRGPVPYFKAMGGPPKRVALVSFYVWDCGNKKESSYTMYGGDYKYRVKNTRTANVESQAVDVLATEIYDASIDGIKEVFAAHGMQLLGPDEYLDTPDKKAAFEKLDIDAGFTQKFYGHFAKGNAETWRFAGAPEGYRVLKMATNVDVKGNHFDMAARGVGVGKIAHTLGFEMARALGVDAVAILYNVVQADKKDISMKGSGLYMFGPNPVPDTGASLYWDGHQYSGVYLRMDVPFVVTDKEGQLVSSDYEGYGIVAKALATRIGNHLVEKTKGGK